MCDPGSSGFQEESGEYMWKEMGQGVKDVTQVTLTDTNTDG